MSGVSFANIYNLLQQTFVANYKLMYDFYDRMNSTNTIDYLENLRKHVMNSRWKRLILMWDHASFHVSKMMNDYFKTQKDWLTTIYLPKKAPYLNPNERKINQQEGFLDQMEATEKMIEKRCNNTPLVNDNTTSFYSHPVNANATYSVAVIKHYSGLDMPLWAPSK